ncbi:MAG TPA: Gfo/Idh/MocA family oxidoreductase [Tepidisphaeraceae bacterium]|jgi:predicted dehydrogenase
MNRIAALSCLVLSACSVLSAAPQPATRLKLGIVGLVHGHAEGFFRGGALVPAGGLLNRPDVELVGIVEPDRKLFDSYAKRLHLPAALYFSSIAEMVNAAHPQAVLVCTAPTAHRQVVEECAPLGVHVMMEKPLATTYADALAIQHAAEQGKIHVLVDFETTWYASNAHAANLLKSGDLGPLVKAVFRDGHPGPVKIHVQPEFLAWLRDPKQGGDGALVDFGCYGANLMTWLMNGQAPQSVTAVTKRMQPDLYPKVDDEAEIILNYPNAVAILQASWNWPFNVKQMDVYGRTGYAKAIDSKNIEVRTERHDEKNDSSKPAPLAPPYDDPIHYLAAVISGEIQEGDDLSSMKNNMIVTEILDAAFQSAETGTTITLPPKP